MVIFVCCPKAAVTCIVSCCSLFLRAGRVFKFHRVGRGSDGGCTLGLHMPWSRLLAYSPSIGTVSKGIASNQLTSCSYHPSTRLGKPYDKARFLVFRGWRALSTRGTCCDPSAAGGAV